MIVDVILLLILLVCALSGYRRGLLLGLMSLLVAVLCCLGATAARNTLTPRAVEWLEPRLEAAILPSVETELRQEARQTLEQAGEVGFTVAGQTMTVSDLTAFLRQFGIDVETTVTEGAADALEPVAQAAARALARTFAEKLAGALIFFGVFLILYLALRSVALAVNLVDRLPVIHGFNRAGGLLLGLGGGLLVMVIGTAVCAEAGLLPGETGPFLSLLVTASGHLL